MDPWGQSLHAFETIASAHVDSLDMGFEQMIAQNRIGSHEDQIRGL